RRAWHRERGRMKLDELEIGDTRTGMERQRDAVACRHRRIRRLAKHPARAARRQQRRTRARVAREPKLIVEADADHAPTLDKQRRDEGVVLRLDGVERAYALPEHARDLASRRVARVQHPPHAVGGFTAARKLPVGVTIEPRSPVDKLLHVFDAVVDEHTHDRFVAQTVAGFHRVGGVQLGTIVIAERDGDASLRVARVAFGGLGLRQNQYAAHRRQRDRGAQAGDAAADDHEIGRQVHGVLSYHSLSAHPFMPPIRIDVPTPSRSYSVFLEDGLLDRVATLLDELKLPARRFVVSSPLVWRLHGARVARGARRLEPILVPDGERSKHLQTVSRIYDALVKATADRSSTLVTFGGGVIGDMAGYAASTYLRGIP
ncbi:MAG TPA: hypothetical protein VFF43_07395, partial [Caldimonas sp.]|nr:hypothetical protein [Caldimonas sp.]